jgi:hypothetical protein
VRQVLHQEALVPEPEHVLLVHGQQLRGVRGGEREVWGGGSAPASSPPCRPGMLPGSRRRT